MYICFYILLQYFSVLHGWSFHPDQSRLDLEKTDFFD